jgi:hypothetical protein
MEIDARQLGAEDPTLLDRELSGPLADCCGVFVGIRKRLN